MRRVIGRFYFKIISDQNISGHFSNNLHIGNFFETADRIPDTAGNGFIGTYTSSWTDDTGAAQATLVISHKLNSASIFSLHWTGITSQFDFWGEGFIIDGILLGDYRNFSNI